MTLPVDICNWALLRLGQPRINSIDPPYTDTSGVSAACGFVYPLARDAELRANRWSFARARASIAADPVKSAFGGLNRFRLPPDFLRLIKTKYEERRIEGQFVLTYEGAPLDLKYVALVDPSMFDPMFVKALSCSIALELTEQITTSTSKKQDIKQDYTAAISEAKRINAIEAPNERTPEDTFITVRR